MPLGQGLLWLRTPAPERWCSYCKPRAPSSGPGLYCPGCGCLGALAPAKSPGWFFWCLFGCFLLCLSTYTWLKKKFLLFIAPFFGVWIGRVAHIRVCVVVYLLCKQKIRDRAMKEDISSKLRPLLFIFSTVEHSEIQSFCTSIWSCTCFIRFIIK